MASKHLARPVGMLVAAVPLVSHRNGKSPNYPTLNLKKKVVCCDGQIMGNLSTVSTTSARSMLSVNSAIQGQYPTILQGIIKGYFDPSKVIESELMIPVECSIPIEESVVRSRHVVTSEMQFAIQTNLQGHFPDVNIAKDIAAQMADNVYNDIERGIQAAERDQTWLQWAMREDVKNKINLPFQMTHETANHTTIAMMEGATFLRRTKGALSKDMINIRLQISVKALFVNRFIAQSIEQDPETRKEVAEAPNRLVQQLKARPLPA